MQPLAAAADIAEPIVVPVLNTGEETPGDAVHSPSWSADGRYLTFVAGVNLLEWEIGATATRLVYAGTGTLGGGTSEEISARSRWCVTAATRGLSSPVSHEPRILCVAFLGVHAFRRRPAHATDRVYCWRRPATLLARRPARRICQQSLRNNDVYIAAADGSAPWRLTDMRSRIVGFARWSPTGSGLRFTPWSERSGSCSSSIPRWARRSASPPDAARIGRQMGSISTPRNWRRTHTVASSHR